MKKAFSIILRIICGYCGIVFLLGALGGVINCFLNSSEIIAYLILSIFCFAIGFLLTRFAFGKQKVSTPPQNLTSPVTNDTHQLNINSVPDNSSTTMENSSYPIETRYEETDKSPDITPRNQRSNCNCNGCSKQNVCEYGYIIYDEFTKERLTLADKFIMLNAFNMDSFKPYIDCSIDIIWNIQDLHDSEKINTYPKDVIQNTLFYLQEEKKIYLAYGKCGRAYFNFMNMNGPINNLKSILKVLKTQTST